jgi:hypothetical protein
MYRISEHYSNDNIVSTSSRSLRLKKSCDMFTKQPKHGPYSVSIMLHSANDVSYRAFMQLITQRFSIQRRSLYGKQLL